MPKQILLVAHVDESGNGLPKAAYEALTAAIKLARDLAGALTIGIFGERIRDAADSVAIDEVPILGVSGPEFAYPRYSTDAVAIEAICREASPDIVLAPATSRLLRVLPGVAVRIQGQIDTHVTAIEVRDGTVTARRWFYRQRLEGIIQRPTTPWFLLLDPGCHQPFSGPRAKAAIRELTVSIPHTACRTSFIEIRTPQNSAQTIRPDAKLLFVAGAGWCKKQSDGKIHVSEAESTILDFLRNSGASLGGSKSLVDQTGENQQVLKFMTHLNQVGQTGSTPRHPKGLSTCCHGEEPHVVGWRFINERRAINLDPNCGWARGKADVLYVADAFDVMGKLNTLLAEKPQEQMATIFD